MACKRGLKFPINAHYTAAHMHTVTENIQKATVMTKRLKKGSRKDRLGGIVKVIGG